jgi:iron(III) transport system ATP-binding protein
MNTIHINNISFFYKKGEDVFRDFSLQLEQPEGKGKVTAIMGSSGSGKSTLMKLLLGIEKPFSGSIEMQPVNPVFSYVPQEPVLFEHLSIKDNARYFQFAGAFKSRFNENLYNELVKSLGLEEVINARRTVLELSGGQMQRLSLLRALSIEPDFLLLDEPCNGLDAEVKRSFLNKLREITQRYGLFVLYITHHKLEAQLIADEVVYLLQDKNSMVKQAAKGTILEFMEAPPVLEAAYIFRSTEVKILPLKKNANGNVQIAKDENEVSEYWLVEEENIQLSSTDGFPFKVISKSSVYTVIRNEEAGIVWVLPRKFLDNVVLGENIMLKVTEPKAKYNQTNNEIKND